MGKASHFLLLLWKNLVQLKRAPRRTFSQIAMPLFFIVILVLLRAFVVKDEHRPKVTYVSFGVNELPPDLTNESKWKMAFAPNTSDVRQIMDMVATQLSLVKVTGFQNEDEMVRVLVSEEQNRNRQSNQDALFLGGIAFNNSLNTGDIIYKIRLSSKSKKIIRENKSVEIGVYPSITWDTQFTFPVFQDPGPRESNSMYGGPPYYFEDGFLSLQHAVDLAIIKFKGNMSVVNTVVSVKRFPYPDCVDDPLIVAIQTTLPLLLMLSLIYTALNIVRDVVYEKEKKLKVRKIDYEKVL